MPADEIRKEIRYDRLQADFVPSDAEGELRSMPFYFHARWNMWGFAMVESGRTDLFVMLDIAQTVPEKRRDSFQEEVLQAFQSTFVRIKDDYGPDEFTSSRPVICRRRKWRS